MSKIIGVKWVCPACEYTNKKDIKKPTVITPTIAKDFCRVCASHFTMSFIKVHAVHDVQYTFKQYELTVAGEAALKVVTDRKNESKQTASAKTI